MDRTIIATGVLLAGVLAAKPVLAQDLVAQDHVFTVDRPDGHAPSGIKSDFLLPKGGIYVGYRYFADKYSGSVVGTDAVTTNDVLNVYTVAPVTHNSWTGELDVRYGVTNWVTAELSVPWTRNQMVQTTATSLLNSSSQYIGDVRLRGLFDLLEEDEYRLSVTVGGSAPTGPIGRRGTAFTGNNQILPFNMQGGSGSWDALVGGTFLAQNETSSVGAQINAVVRFMDNKQDYRLGDEFEFSAWGAINISEWVSVSMRALYQHWAAVSGTDARTDGAIDPLSNPTTTGGERVFIPFGINLYLREGRAAGHRLSLEFYYPVFEDLNGPHFSAGQTLVISWQALF